ncbi:Hypothetical predicted protein [Olea europaea subsp. europaea]|uniref:Uncharacterized protein n=1 Tax=Olea europaea subsp. europaea TaxID=158383 RepID=A0A8S0QXJ5_OLEEU|nr:Hypothetical predicted protein [Olea europaea subsp. europaea]
MELLRWTLQAPIVTGQEASGSIGGSVVGRDVDGVSVDGDGDGDGDGGHQWSMVMVVIEVANRRWFLYCFCSSLWWWR